MTTIQRKGRKGRKVIGPAFVVIALAAFAIQFVDAHKAITSKYTYNDDVFPIFRERCAKCHVPGGVAPMSLMTYDDAFPWAESIRAELVAAHMPPWNADEAFGDLKHAHTLSAKELDVILTWATGGNPRGALDQKLPAVALKNDWPMGKPDLALPIPSEFAFAADKMEDTQEFTVATGVTEPRWVRAVDLLPGTPSIVRSAVIFLKNAAPEASAPAKPAPETVLARWVPGHDPEPLDNSLGYRLPTGAQLGVRIHYKKTWQFEGKPMSDRSTVGVYFAPAQTAQELLALPIVSSELAQGSSERTITFSQTIDDDMQALAVGSDRVPPNITVQVEAVRPDGSRAPMIRLNTRADWDRRYWFERPVALPRGTRIEITANLQDPDLQASTVTSASAAAPASSRIRLTVNVVPTKSKPAAP